VPIYRQIARELMERIDRGDIAEQSRLPPSRRMAGQLGVNRSTVYRAYQELWALGYLESSPGSYSRVRRRRAVAEAGEQERSVPLIDWGRQVPEAVKEISGRYAAELTRMSQLTELPPAGVQIIDFSLLAPDRRFFPSEAFRKCLNTVLVNEGGGLLAYGDPRGLPALREYIAERLRLHAIHADPDEIVLTAGAQNAIELILTCFVPRGRSVAVESPSYSRAVGLARLRGLDLLPVPMGEDGMDLDELEQLLSNRPPSLIYTIPNFHNPTGITTDQRHRERLLGMCEHAGVPLAEDGFEEEMKYFGTNILPIKSMDGGGTVLYIGTFSKVLFPGLRIGWIAADRRAAELLTAVQKYSLLCSSPADQAALALFCRRGWYDSHLKQMHRIYRSRMETALRALSEYIPPDRAEWSRPLGGYSLWLKIITTAFRDEEQLLRRLARRGVLVSPGGEHYLHASDGIRLRLSLGEVDEEHIVEGIRRIGEVLRDG
jgi:DNA-binding transcriptional MocR family regulator